MTKVMPILWPTWLQNNKVALLKCLSHKEGARLTLSTARAEPEALDVLPSDDKAQMAVVLADWIAAYGEKNGWPVRLRCYVNGHEVEGSTIITSAPNRAPMASAGPSWGGGPAGLSLMNLDLNNLDNLRQMVGALTELGRPVVRMVLEERSVLAGELVIEEESDA